MLLRIFKYAVLLVILGCTTNIGYSLETKITDSRQSIFYVKTYLKSNSSEEIINRGSGSGFCVCSKLSFSGNYRNYIVTAYHVINTNVTPGNYKEISCSPNYDPLEISICNIEAYDTSLDLALLSFTTDRLVVPLSLSKTSPGFGEKIYCVGSAGEDPFAVVGLYGSKSLSAHTHYGYLPILPGISGAPVMLQSSNKVIGLCIYVASSTHGPVYHMCYFVSSLDILSFLDRNYKILKFNYV